MKEFAYRLDEVMRHLTEKGGHKITNIAKAIGYTSTAQLHNVLFNGSIMTTKPLQKLVEEYKVNPTYLLLGEGEMFITPPKNVAPVMKHMGILGYKLEIHLINCVNDHVFDRYQMDIRLCGGKIKHSIRNGAASICSIIVNVPDDFEEKFKETKTHANLMVEGWNT